MIGIVRKVLQEHGGLHTPVDTLTLDADLYAAGLSPFAAIKVVLALESEFGVEFPAAMLRRQKFSSISAIVASLVQARAFITSGYRRAA